MPNDNVPEPIESETPTVPVPTLTNAELVRQPRRQWNPDWDCDNGVDDRGKW